MQSKLEIITADLTAQEVDCIVNAAKSSLDKGEGVCGAVYEAAGEELLAKACREIGHCHTGDVVMTPGFNLKAKYIIHAVGPRWVNGNIGEQERLYSCYNNALYLAMELECHTIAFPLISSGVYAFPKDKAWQTAIQAITDFQLQNEDYRLDVVVANFDSEITDLGKAILKELRPEESEDEFLFFWKESEENGMFATRYRSEMVVEEIKYHSAEQYYMAKKALMFDDIKQYFLIMSETDPKRCKAHGQSIHGFDPELWAEHMEEVAFHANYYKFLQNPELKQALLATGNKLLVYANPHDTNWGIAIKAGAENAMIPARWKGRNLQGKVLMRVRAYLR